MSIILVRYYSLNLVKSIFIKKRALIILSILIKLGVVSKFSTKKLNNSVSLTFNYFRGQPILVRHIYFLKYNKTIFLNRQNIFLLSSFLSGSYFLFLEFKKIYSAYSMMANNKGGLLFYLLSP